MSLGKLFRTFSLSIGVIGAFAVAEISPVFAQSTDFSRPTPVTAVPIIGEYDGAQDQSHFYAFEAGPGSILITLDGRASKYSTNMQVRVSDANRNEIGQVYLVASTSPSSESKRFTLNKRQKVVLETINHQDTSMGVLRYSINVSGPVQLARESAVPTVANTPSVAPARMSGGGGGGNRLHIEMRDGSTRDIDMSLIRRIVVE